jgi:hypothetical protein
VSRAQPHLRLCLKLISENTSHQYTENVTSNNPEFVRYSVRKWIRSARLRWAGHIVRMRESDPARKSTFDQLLGERTVGRPKRRWIEEVETELKGVGVKD